jgi:hypothetical protein
MAQAVKATTTPVPAPLWSAEAKGRDATVLRHVIDGRCVHAKKLGHLRDRVLVDAGRPGLEPGALLGIIDHRRSSCGRSTPQTCMQARAPPSAA